MKRWAVFAIVLAGGSASADRDQALGRLEKALPAGWSLLATDSELVIRHDRPVYCSTHPNGPLVTLELRYKLEPKWTPERYAEAKAANDKIAVEIGQLEERYKIRAIRQRDGHPDPATKDERSRLRAFQKARGVAQSRSIQPPVCTLDHSVIVVRPDTYAQLQLAIDPAEAKAEALTIQELVTKSCPPP
jgi:hypothetical protein